MKGAKLMLGAIALFAVIGGAFAFKAASSKSLYFTTLGTTDCTFRVIGRATTAQVPNQSPVTTALVPLAETSGACTLTAIYYTAP